MRLVKVKKSFYQLCQNHGVDNELLFNERGRPCVLLLKLHYKNNRYDFVAPLRSNISPKTPRKHYFSLPPNPNTKPYHKHGVHYTKLFPIDKKYIESYNVNGDAYYKNILCILSKNESTIVKSCQDYLKSFEGGNKCYVTPDIDGILTLL